MLKSRLKREVFKLKITNAWVAQGEPKLLTVGTSSPSSIILNSWSPRLDPERTSFRSRSPLEKWLNLSKKKKIIFLGMSNKWMSIVTWAIHNGTLTYHLDLPWNLRVMFAKNSIERKQSFNPHSDNKVKHYFSFFLNSCF